MGVIGEKSVESYATETYISENEGQLMQNSCDSGINGVNPTERTSL